MSATRLFTAIALLPLAACASGGADGFPDLAPRAVEGRLETRPPEPIALPPPPPPAADLASRLVQLSDSADTADARFRGALPSTQALVRQARGAAVSSEAWVAAQTAISALDADRAPASDALAELDALQISRADAGDRAGTDEIALLRDQLIALVADQRATIDALLAQLQSA